MEHAESTDRQIRSGLSLALNTHVPPSRVAERMMKAKNPIKKSYGKVKNQRGRNCNTESELIPTSGDDLAKPKKVRKDQMCLVIFEATAKGKGGARR